MDSISLKLEKLTNEDTLFLECVMIDIRSFINALRKTRHNRRILLFPPVNNFRRFLIHHLVDTTFREDELNTFSIGSLYARRTVVYPSSLKPMEAKPTVALTPKKNDTEKRIPEVPLYRPPALRKPMDNVRPRIRERKARKPDIQIYVPRGRRLLASQESLVEETELKASTEPVNELKSPTESKKQANLTEESNNTSDNDCILVSDLESSPESNAEIPMKKLKGTEDLKKKSIEEAEITAEDQTNLNAKFDLQGNGEDKSNCETNEIKLIDLTYDEDQEKVSSPEECKIIDVSYESNTISLSDREQNECDAVIQNKLIEEQKAETDPSSNDFSAEVNSKETESTQIEKNAVVLEDNVLDAIIDNISSRTEQTELRMNSSTTDDSVTIASPAVSSSKSTQNTLLKVTDCDWEELFDENGDYVDESLINELMTAIGKTSIQHAAQNYTPFQTVEERTSDGGCIIEVYGFPADFKTDDLFSIFAPYRIDKAFQIVWVDDTHALAIFSSPVTADEVLNTELPFIKTRPLKNAIAKSRMKAQDYIAPPATRPKTCVSLARRLVSGHLGMKIQVTDKQKEAERRLLSDAREKRRLVAKQKQDAWEGNMDDEKL